MATKIQGLKLEIHLFPPYVDCRPHKNMKTVFTQKPCTSSSLTVESRESITKTLMATTTSTNPLQTLSITTTTTTTTSLSTTKPRPHHISLPTRRHLLFLLTLSTTATTPFLTPKQPAISRAEDIPLFGFRRTLKKAEQETEEIVREGFEAAEKGIVAAEKGVEAAEREIEVVEREVEGAVSFGGLAQAGVVAGAEVVGVVVATAVVNGILGPEAKRS